MDWTFRSDQPIYLQLQRHLSEAIVNGFYSPGQRMPSVRDIALDAGVNPNTVQRALAELERDKWVFSQRTSGRFVTDDPEQIRSVGEAMAKEKVDEFLKAMRKIGMSRRDASAFLEKEEETT